MFINKRHRAAWAAHDITVQALTKFAAQLELQNGSKLSREDAETLCKLSAEVERWQERIRLHRLPATKRLGAKSRARAKTQARREVGAKAMSLPTPTPVEPTDSPSEP